MAGPASDPRSLRRTLAAARAPVGILCSLIALSLCAAAIAAPVHDRTPGTGSSAATKASGLVTASTQPESAASAAAPPAGEGAGTPAPAAPGTVSGGRAGRGASAAARARHGRRPGTGAAGAASPEAKSSAGAAAAPATVAAGGASPANVSPAGTAHKRVRHDTPKESARVRHTPQPASSSSTTAGEAAPASAPSTASTPSVSAAAPAAAPVTAAGLAPNASQPALPASQSSGTAPARRSPTRRASRAASPAAAAAPAAAGAALEPVLAAADRPRSAARAGSTVPRAPRRARAGESPLAGTVTRIIDVVPGSIRILIGLLLALALALAASSRLAALRARRLAAQRMQLLEDVGLLQAALLPPLPARLGPVGTSAAYRPASGPGAGGDFYDVFALGDGQVAVIVGDVSGHGRAALPQTTLLRFTLRAYLEAGLSPRAALQTAAPVLERQLGDSFATVLLATYHPRERILVYASAGHPPPLLLGSEAIAPITACSAPPIGVGQPTGTRQTTVWLPGAALACFHTDGVLEARVRGELFGVDRLERELAGLDGEATASGLLDRVAADSDRQPDDMAACLLQIEGEPCVPSVRVEELEVDSREMSRDRVKRFLLAGGVHDSEVDAALTALRSEVARYGRVVLELHLGGGAPEILLRPQNLTALTPTVRRITDNQEMLA